MKKITTEVAAEQLCAKPQTLRKNFCLSGHYLGIKPIKLPNRRLLWPADEVARIAAGLPATEEAA